MIGQLFNKSSSVDILSMVASNKAYISAGVESAMLNLTLSIIVQ